MNTRQTAKFAKVKHDLGFSALRPEYTDSIVKYFFFFLNHADDVSI